MDSQCYFVKLSYDYWKATGINALFDVEWKGAVEKIIETWLIEQNHNEQSKYTYPTLDHDRVRTNERINVFFLAHRFT